ncbi:hypothetical protein BaRGS_00039914 [Batillaria attramentaria]|uniref:Uncharacterized protein n=1 Tax=Batillaria attramentaria TaxID=370345 RepID=A0ABD0J199_9CAEN
MAVHSGRLSDFFSVHENETEKKLIEKHRRCQAGEGICWPICPRLSDFGRGGSGLFEGLASGMVASTTGSEMGFGCSQLRRGRRTCPAQLMRRLSYVRPEDKKYLCLRCLRDY